MAITAAQILVFVNNQLERSETSVDEEIIQVLNELSDAGLLLGVDTAGTLTVASPTMAFPSDCKSPVTIVLNDGSVDLAPLKPLPGGYARFRDLMQSMNTGLYGSPTHYAVFNKVIYPYLPPGQSYTVTLSYRKRHAQSATTISFGDEFRNAIYFGTTYYVALKYAISRYIGLWQPKYAEAFMMRRLDNDDQPAIVGG